MRVWWIISIGIIEKKIFDKNFYYKIGIEYVEYRI